MTGGRRPKIDSMLKIKELVTATALRFFAPLEELYPKSERKYDCQTLSDLDFAALGTLRCLTHAKTGHEFLQDHAEKGGRDENPDLFFKALKSKRRLANLTSSNDALAPIMAEQIEDPLGHFSELKGYHFFAADGHYQKAACFDASKSTRKGPQKIATGHFFRVNLRTHHLSHLALSRPADGKKKEHDARVIQRATINNLRYQVKTGEKAVYFWDKACIDYKTWQRLKQSGIYFVACEKSNSALETLSENNAELTDPRNEGIISDTYVGNNGSGMLRRIVYQDPSDGKIYTYLTNEFQLPAWVIAVGYKHRWDIEKIFDQFKNKMKEKKSWASSETAKESHAIFECLAHNLSLLFEEKIKTEENITDEREVAKKTARQKTRKNREGESYVVGKNFINQIFTRPTQRTVRYLRWLRNWLYREAPWSQAVIRLAKVWGISTG